MLPATDLLSCPTMKNLLFFCRFYILLEATRFLLFRIRISANTVWYIIYIGVCEKPCPLTMLRKNASGAVSNCL